MNEPIYARLLAFLNELEGRSIWYTLRRSRREAINVIIDVPGERWEVEFMEDGTLEIEKFVTTGEIRDESAIEELFRRFSDE